MRSRRKSAVVPGDGKEQGDSLLPTYQTETGGSSDPKIHTRRRRKRRRKISRIKWLRRLLAKNYLGVLVAFSTILVLFCLSYILDWLLNKGKPGGEPLSAASPELSWNLASPSSLILPKHRKVPVASGSANATSFSLPLPLNESVLEEYGDAPDFGDLDLLVFEEEGQARAIMHDPYFDQGYQDEDEAGEVFSTANYYYAFDDDFLRSPYQGWEDDSIRYERQCRRTSWHRNVPLNCHLLHELGLASNALPHLQFLAEGAYRRVFQLDIPLPRGKSETFAFKGYYYEEDYDYSYEDMEEIRKDALVSERLTSSPRIADIYGFCGLSMLSEYFAGGDLLHRSMRKHYRRVEVPTLNDKEDVDPHNNFTATEKLGLALEMAESIADLHGFEGGVIVHDDMKPAQFLYTDDGELRLNDFNRAEIMLWDEDNREYCKYRNGEGPGAWRAPEEFLDKPLDEKIDVWSFGMSVYVLFTGLFPFYDMLEIHDVQRAVRHQQLPFIDARYRNRSFAESELVDVMETCWTFDADKRTDIFQIVKRLRQAVQKNEQLNKIEH